EGPDVMSKVFSARVFSLVFGLAYAAAVYINYPLFRYYPLAQQFSLQDLKDPALGPAMSWFGWIAVGLIAALVASAVVPKRIGDRIPAWIFWIVIVLMFVAAWQRERDWFLPVG